MLYVNIADGNIDNTTLDTYGLIEWCGLKQST